MRASEINTPVIALEKKKEDVFTQQRDCSLFLSALMKADIRETKQLLQHLECVLLNVGRKKISQEVSQLLGAH